VRNDRFIIATNDISNKLTVEQLLNHYKSQQSVEKGFRFIKLINNISSLIPISINKCSLRMCPASFNRGAVLQEWLNAVTDPLSKGCNEHGMREIKVAGAFPSGP
jgi:hypothetical protein